MVASTVFDLPAWSARLMTEFDAADERAKKLADRLSVDQLNWQPRPGAWSIGQCLEHLCIGNELYFPAISASLAGKPFATVHEITPGRLSRWFIRNYIDPNPRTRRATAPRKIIPRARVEGSVLDRFLRANQVAREVVQRASNHNVNRIRFRNPFIPLIHFTVGTGLEIVVRHERRHLLQAERVKDLSEFPG